MYCNKIVTAKSFAAFFFLGIILSPMVRADFLELPEVKEIQEFKPKTLLRDMEIPAVRERSPDPKAGPRLAVSEFRIQGLVEYPELGITRQALADLVESIRFDLMGEGKQLDSGYTLDELGQVSDLLVDIEKETLDRHVTPYDVQKLVFLIRDQQAKRGITLGQIETVANRITTFYRERGFILAKAYIPKQQVREGIVNLTLLLGMLGEVNVTNNKMYSTPKIKSVFDSLMTKPVTSSAIEERLYLINDYPGISVDGYFEPGYQIGDTRLNITVRNESKYSSNLRVDNHGTEASGLYRYYADFQVNDLLGNADSLSASVLRASSPSNTTYYRLLYDTDFFVPKLRFVLETSKNQFSVNNINSLNTVVIHGDITVQALTGKYIFSRGRTANTNLELRYEKLLSQVQVGDFTDPTHPNDDKLKNISLNYNFDFLQEAKSRLHQGNLKVLSGKYDYGFDLGQKDSYHIVSGGYSLLTFWKIPFTDSTSRLVFRTNAQYAWAKLAPAMQYSLAGPTRARGYSPSTFGADYGIYAGGDWIFNSPDLFDFTLWGVNFKNVAKPFVFVDTAYGVQRTLLPTEASSKLGLTDAGIGLQFAYEKRFSGNLQLAFPYKEHYKTSSSTTKIVKDNYRVVFDFEYSF
ncbi:MAG: ShlB/FhaC/HecB family hemolysin secretion/activation protein [Gammaproteobacteria bacterium]|nr:ShlB/FhaC/HecB family hemolysin secretion/activation protein [Gammaproteobacteria bacterium]